MPPKRKRTAKAEDKRRSRERKIDVVAVRNTSMSPHEVPTFVEEEVVVEPMESIILEHVDELNDSTTLMLEEMEQAGDLVEEEVYADEEYGGDQLYEVDPSDVLFYRQHHHSSQAVNENECFRPIVLEDGQYQCRMCPDYPVFPSRSVFYTHRYRLHGSFMNTLACPDPNCDGMFASLQTIKRHLITEHQAPVEDHRKIFAHETQFWDWMQDVQAASRSRFIPHVRQAPGRRQTLYCVKSDHKRSHATLMRRSMPTERRHGMMKDGACCPACISYLIDPETGSVDVQYQLAHYGHTEHFVQVDENGKVIRIERETWPLDSILMAGQVQFPVRPLIVGERCMQYVQMDIINMDTSEYANREYAYILVVTDLYSRYLFARALPDSTDEATIIRHLLDIFGQFGPPEAFSSSHHYRLLNHAMEELAKSFSVTIRPVGSVTPTYAPLIEYILSKAETELGDRSRWVEVLPFVVIGNNQTPNRAFDYRFSPFEVMFSRRPWRSPAGRKDDKNKNLDESTEANVGEHEDGEWSADHVTLKHGAIVQRLISDEDLAILQDTVVSRQALPQAGRERTSQIVEQIESRCNNSTTNPNGHQQDNTTDSGVSFRKSMNINTVFEVGDRVYIRNFDYHEEYRNQTKRNRYLPAIIAEVDWSRPEFPYRVHYWDEMTWMKHGGHGYWPDKEVPDLWISAFDVTSSNDLLANKRNLERSSGDSRDSLLCECDSQPPCPLFRSELCDQRMSAACCEQLRLPCTYHSPRMAQMAAVSAATAATANRKEADTTTEDLIVDDDNVVDERQQSPSKGPKKRSANAIGNSRSGRPIRASRRFKTEKTGDSAVAGYPGGSNESMFITDQSEQPNTMNEAIESDNTIDEPKRAKRTVVRQLLSTGRRLMSTSSHTVVDVTMVNSRCAEIESNMAAVESKMNAMREVALDTEKNREFVELNAQYRLLQMEWSAARKSMSDRSSQLRMAELSRQAPKRRRDRPSTPEPSGYLMTGDEVLSIYQPVNSAGGTAGGQMAEEEVEVDDSNATAVPEVAPMKARGILRRRGPDQKTAISLRKSLSSYSRTIE